MAQGSFLVPKTGISQLSVVTLDSSLDISGSRVAKALFVNSNRTGKHSEGQWWTRDV